MVKTDLSEVSSIFTTAIFSCVLNSPLLFKNYERYKLIGKKFFIECHI